MGDIAETECPVFFQLTRRAKELYGDAPELAAQLGTLGTAEDEQTRATSLVDLARTSAATVLDGAGLTKDAQAIRDLDTSKPGELRDALRDLRYTVTSEADRRAIQAAYACAAHYACALNGVDERGATIANPRDHWALAAANAAECIPVADVKTWTQDTAALSSVSEPLPR